MFKIFVNLALAMLQSDTTENTLHELASKALNSPADTPVIEFDNEWICWGKLQAVANQIRALLQGNQIEAGATVALIARNHPACIAAFVALIAERLHIRMIYPFQSPTGIAAEIDEVKPAAVIALDAEFTEPVQAVMKRENIAAIKILDYCAAGIPGLSRQSPSRGDTTNFSIEILTSGTTGRPKPFRVRYEMIARDLMATSTTGAANAPDPANIEPVLLYFPIGNISGLYTTLPAILSGRRIVLLERFSVKGWHDFVVRFRPAASGMPPAAIRMLLDANIPGEDLSSIRVFGAGAAPLDPAVQKNFEERYGIPILLSYGATEFGGPVTRMTPEMYAEHGQYKTGTVGKAMPGVQLRVIDPETHDILPPGREGILEVVSPRIGSEWIRTSDIALLDEDGYLFHRGRADGAIIRGGFKILPETVEKALLQHPSVSAAAVVGIADDRLGQVPVAAIITTPGQQLTAQELDAFLRERVLKTHVPVKWRFVEDFPRTELSFKVDQVAVRGLFE